MADGSITIEAKVLTDKFDKQIQKLDEKISKKEKQKIKISTEIADIEKQQAEYKKLTSEAEKYKRTVDYIQEVQFRRGQQGLPALELTESAKDIINKYANVQRNIEESSQSMKKLSQRSDELAEKSNEITQSIKKYKNQIESVKLQKQQAQVDQIKNGFNKMNTSVSSSIKHIGRLALGIFSVASAYRLMSSASSTLGQYDEQYATNLEYIRYLIAQAIAPALKYVVNLASTLLSYLNYIAQAWFKVTLFSKNSSKNFMKARESTSKIKKDLQTTPFDEMNVLSDTSSSGTSGVVAPSIDPSMLQGEVPDWLKWIADNKDLVIMALVGIAGGIALITGNWQVLLGLGIFMIIKGIVDTIKAIIEFIKDPSWENFGEILKGLSEILFGVALAMLAVNAANPTAWIILLIALVALLVAEIIKHWDKIKEVLGKVGDWINEHVIRPVAGFFQSLWEKIKGIFTPFISFFKNIFETVGTNIKTTVENIKQIFTFLWNKIKEIFNPVADWFKDKFERARNKIREVFSPIAQFFSEMWDKIKNKLSDFGAKVGETVGGAFKAVVNGVLRAIENILNSPIRAVNKLINVINKVPGINLGKLQTFNLPRLAKGTILNAPGRGVPVAGGKALAGEAGREAYLPLSDTQLLEELGSTIGKYITINANITNTMNGRVISRQLQQIRNDREFAYNG